MRLKEQENAFLFEFGLIVPAVLKCFDIISADVVYHLQKSYPNLLIFAPIKDFLDVYNVEQPCETQIYLKASELLKVSSTFDIYSFVQISRNLGDFCASRKIRYILGNKPSTLEKF